MTQWPTEVVFVATGILSGLTGAAAESRQHKRITKWQAMNASVFWGCTGMALGMLCYQWLGGDAHQERIVAIGMMVGLRWINQRQIKAVISVFIPNGKNDDNDSENV